MEKKRGLTVLISLFVFEVVTIILGGAAVGLPPFQEWSPGIILLARVLGVLDGVSIVVGLGTISYDVVLGWVRA
jgi:hypothetical protein